MHNFDSDWMETTWMWDNWRRRPQPWRWIENHMLKTSSSVNSRWRHPIAAVVAVTTTDLCPTVSSDSEAARVEVDFDASTWCGDFDTYEMDRKKFEIFHWSKKNQLSIISPCLDLCFRQIQLTRHLTPIRDWQVLLTSEFSLEKSELWVGESRSSTSITLHWHLRWAQQWFEHLRLLLIWLLGVVNARVDEIKCVLDTDVNLLVGWA